MGLDGFWLGMAMGIPVYLLLDHYVIPVVWDDTRRLRTRTRRRLARATHRRGR